MVFPSGAFGQCVDFKKISTWPPPATDQDGSDYCAHAVPYSAGVSLWPVHGNCTIAPLPRRARETSDADRARPPAL